MKKDILTFLIIISILISVGEGITQRSVYLLSHQWCRKCDKTIQILQKIKTNFDKVYSQNLKLNIHFLHSYQDFLDDTNKSDHESQPQMSLEQQATKAKQIYTKIQQKYKIKASQVPFPTIWFQCPSFYGIYQNEVSYLELEYWINLNCFNKLPFCSLNEKHNTKNKKLSNSDYQLALTSQAFEKEQNNSIFSHYPFVKACIHKKNEQINQIQKRVILPNNYIKNFDELESGPLFCSSFNHNVRNYLFNTQNEHKFMKIGIFIIFSSPSHPKVRQFIQMYKFISDLIQGSKQNHKNEGRLSTIFGFNQSHKQELQSQYHQSSIKNYDIKGKEQIFNQLAFIGACYNDNKRDCIMKYQYSVDEDKGKQKDPSQKPRITKYQIPFSFMGTKKQNIKRLMEFANIRNKFQSESGQDTVKNHGVQIVAFHFDKKSQTIKGYDFDDVQINLGNSFLFWIQSIYSHVFKSQKSIKSKIKMQTFCLSSQLTHAISERNLTTIKHNIHIKKIIEYINQVSSPKDKIKLHTIVAEIQPQKIKQFQIHGSQKWRSEYFKYCIQDQIAKYLSYQEIIGQLTKLTSKEKQKEQNLHQPIDQQQL